MLNRPINGDGESGIAKCGKCACQFDYDVHTEQNLEFSRAEKVLKLVCPACDNGRPICTCEEEKLELDEMCEPCRNDYIEKLAMAQEQRRDEEREESCLKSA